MEKKYRNDERKRYIIRLSKAEIEIFEKVKKIESLVLLGDPNIVKLFLLRYLEKKMEEKNEN